MTGLLLYYMRVRHVYNGAVALILFGMGTFYYVQVFSYQVPVAVATEQSLEFVVAPNTKPTISASAYVVFDTQTGTVLASENLDVEYPIASITKLFTAAAILEVFNPESTTTITWGDVAAEGESGSLEPQQVYTYRELLFPLLLESSNDAALALEHATDGALPAALETVALKYGATHTNFADASGLSADNTATARDLMVFSRAVEAQYPFVYDIAQLPQYIGNYTGWLNNNPVFDTSTYRGGKHGYTPAAGRTLVARFDESFGSEARTIGYIILGSANLTSDTEALRQFVADSVDYQ